MIRFRTGLCAAALVSISLPWALSSCSSGDEAAPAPAVEEAAPAPVVEPPSPEPIPEEVEDKGPPPLSAALQAFLGSLSEEAMAVANPLAGQAEAIETGEAEYQLLCAQCHGKSGNADNAPAARALGVTPPDFSDEHERDRMTDGARFAAMKDGVPDTAMQAFGAAMSDNQIWQLLAYVETLAPSPPEPPAAPGEPAAESGAGSPDPG